MTANGMNKSVGGVEALRSLGVQIGSIERPVNVADAKEILSRSLNEKRLVFPIGGCTAPAAAALPERIDTVIDMTAMNKVVSFDSANLNITVQAGMTIDEINDFLGSQEPGFCLPLDPPYSGRATIGGVYAANSSGPSRLRYGTVRDQILGVQGIDAGGAQVKFGGKVVKNVSGYDMTKFLIGSAGSLCLVTALTLRVYPMPGASSVCEIKFGRLGELERFLESLRASVLLPSAVVAEQINGEYKVSVGFEEHPKAVERQCVNLLDMAKSAGGKGVYRQGRKAMKEVFRDAIEPNEESFAIKITVPISKGPGKFAEVKKLLPQAKSVLYAGNGVICIYSTRANTDATLIKQLKELIRDTEGYIAPVSLPLDLLSKWGSRVDQTLGRYVLQPIKKQLDPAGVFPPVLQ